MWTRRTVLLTACAAAAGCGEEAPPLSFMSLSYSPSGFATEAALAKGVSRDHIRRDLKQMAAYTRHIRTYTVDRGLDQVPGVVRALGMRMSLGLWLGPDPALNDAEIARGLKIMAEYADVIDRVYVGNETLQRKELTAADLVAHIQRVKRSMSPSPITVSTGEAWHDWIANPEVAAAVDFIGLHLLPYWDGVPAPEALDYAEKRLAEVRSAFPGKEIVIAETGWPSGGPIRQAARPALPSQEYFVRGFLARAAAHGYDYNVVEAFDQPWKGHGIEGAVGAFWGLFDKDRKAKFPLTLRQAAE